MVFNEPGRAQKKEQPPLKVAPKRDIKQFYYLATSSRRLRIAKIKVAETRQTAMSTPQTM